MPQKCNFSGTSRQFGHRVSHANNKTKHSFMPNLQFKKIYVTSEKKYIRVRVSTRVIRTIDKIGLEGTLQKYNLRLDDIRVS